MRRPYPYFFVLSIVAIAVPIARFPEPASAGNSRNAPGHAAAAIAATCDRDCLYGFLDQYLKALVAKDPSGLPLAATVKFTENNVAMKVGDGIWNTISGFGPYDIKFADTTAGQVGYLGVVRETHTSSPFALRMKIRDGKISEIETIVARPAGGNAVAGLDQYPDKQVLRDTLAPSERSPRAKMIALVNGYFDTLQQNNGTLHTDFDPDCNREENAMRSTNNPSNHIFPVTNLGCAGQFQEGYFRYDDRARGRRFPVVDEEHGLVLAGMFLDHSGKLGMYKLTDGRELESPMRTPSTLCILELFKIKNGKILQIEAIMAGVPYNMPPVWGK
jgi:hypothetical protein